MCWTYGEGEEGTGFHRQFAKPDAYIFIPNESYRKCIVLQPSVLIQSQHAQNTSLRYYTSNESVHTSYLVMLPLITSIHILAVFITC